MTMSEMKRNLEKLQWLEELETNLTLQEDLKKLKKKAPSQEPSDIIDVAVRELDRALRQTLYQDDDKALWGKSNLQQSKDEFVLWDDLGLDEPTQEMCLHKWKHYVGFNEEYEYCERCDEKRNIREII